MADTTRTSAVPPFIPPPVVGRWHSGGIQPHHRESFVTEVRRLINALSIDVDCQTPDFILAEVLADQLDATAKLVRERERWHGRPC